MARKSRKAINKDFKQLKRIDFPGENTKYLDCLVTLKHNGVTCTDQEYGLRPVKEDSPFVKLIWVGNGYYRLIIDALSKSFLEKDQYNPTNPPILKVSTITVNEFHLAHHTAPPHLDIGETPAVDCGYNPEQEVTYFPTYPVKRLRFEATKLKGSPIIDVALNIYSPLLQGKSGGQGSSESKNEYEKSEAGSEKVANSSMEPDQRDVEENGFSPFKDFEFSDEILGFVEFNLKYRKHIFYFNTRNPDVDFISKNQNVNRTGSSKVYLIRELYKIVNDNLDDHVRRYKTFQEFKDESVLNKYGTIVNYLANERFEIIIRSYINKIKSIN